MTYRFTEAARAWRAGRGLCADHVLRIGRVARFASACLVVAALVLAPLTAIADDSDAAGSSASSDASAMGDLIDSSDVVTTETVDAMAREAQEVVEQNSSSSASAADGEKITIVDDGHSGATSIDSDKTNVVDPAQSADNSFIYDTSIASLADEASIYNGQTVQVVGEVVGDKISADKDNYWITVEAEAPNDSSTISAYVSETLASRVDTYGCYGVTGTRVQVRGVYHQACDEHEGLSDLHVTNLEVSNPGFTHPDTFIAGDFVPGILLMLVGLVVMLSFRFVRERMR